MKTWKIIYYPRPTNPNGALSVAFIAADTETGASTAFQTQYAGQFFTIKSIEEI